MPTVYPNTPKEKSQKDTQFTKSKPCRPIIGQTPNCPKISKIELKKGKLSLDGVVPIIAVLRALPNHGRVTTELVNSNKKKPQDSREEMLFSKNRKERRCRVGTYGVWSLKWSVCCPSSNCGRRLTREVECGPKASLGKDYITLFFLYSPPYPLENTHYGFTPRFHTTTFSFFFFCWLDNTHHYLKLKINLNHLLQVFFRDDISHKYVKKTRHGTKYLETT